MPDYKRANKDELAAFDPATKRCTMNCGQSTHDPRSRAEMILLCDDCEPAPDSNIALKLVKTGTAAEFDAAIKDLNRMTREWELAAARGECGWTCSDCGASCESGMPDECVHGHKRCTELIQRDKQEANAGSI